MLEENKQLDKEQAVKIEQEVSAKVDLPFDLNKLCTFSFDVLKESIEFLARQQAEMNQRMTELENKEKEHVPITIIDRQPVQAPKVEIKEEPAGVPMAVFLQLKNYVYNYNEQNDKDMQQTRDTQKQHHQRLNDLESQIDLIKKMKAPSGDGDGGAGLLDALQEIQDKLRKEFDEKLEALKEELMKRIIALEAKDKDQQEQIDNLTKLFDSLASKLEGLEHELEVLKNCKTDNDTFDKETYELRQMIQALGSGKPVEIRAKTPTGPKVTEADIAKWNQAAAKTDKQEKQIEDILKELDEMNRIKDSLQQINEKVMQCVTQDEFKGTANDVRILKEDMNNAQQDINNLWSELNKLKDHVEGMFFPSMDEFNSLKIRVDKVEHSNQALKKAYGDLESQIKRLKIPDSGANQDQVDRLAEELARLRAEFEQHKDWSTQNIENLNHEMPHKADKQDLIDLENRILDKLRDMIQQILNQFANKDDVMKRFAQLSKKIREIMDLLSRQGGATNNEEDAMFSKRHLGPQACASCEKNLVNMYGQAVDYHAWKKLPFRDPSERIARYGQGFSKILSYMKPSDLLAGGSGQGGSRSPGRNSLNRPHQSIDDSHLNYHHGQSTSTDPGLQHLHYTSNKTADQGFYRGGKTAGDTRVPSRVRAGYATSTTNPGSSVDEVNHLGPRPTDFKSPSSRFNQNSHRERNQTSDEALPQLAANRHLGHSVNK